VSRNWRPVAPADDGREVRRFWALRALGMRNRLLVILQIAIYFEDEIRRVEA
jgi:hypothetical protein